MLSVVPGLMIVHIRTKRVRIRTVYHKHLLPRSSVYISTLVLAHKSFVWRRTVVRLQENDRPPSRERLFTAKRTTYK